jgi:virginiamycin B lyase
MNQQTPQPSPQPLCAAFEPLLPLLSQGQLSASETLATRNHVMTCSSCQLQLHEYDFLRDALRRLDTHDAHDAQADHDSVASNYRPLTREEILQDFQDDYPEDLIHSRHQASIVAAPLPARTSDTTGRAGGFTSLAAAAAALLVVALAATLFRGAAPNPASPGISGAFTYFSLPSAASHPTAIVFGPDGALWFTEAGAGKIGRVTSNGVVTEFPLPSHNARSLPNSIIVGPGGALWFTETDEDKIGRITSQGETTEFSPPYESHPRSIALGADGNLWFTAWQTNRIGRLSPAGQLLGEYATPTAGSEPDSIVAAPDGNLWFTEEAAEKIGRITLQGVVTEYDSPLPVDHPIVAGADGNLWFASSLNGRIGRITPHGEVTFFPTKRLAGALAGMSAGPDGSLWFVLNAAAGSTDPPRIGRITPGGVIDFIQSPERGILNGLTFAPDGNLWFTVNDPAKIGRFNMH